MTLTLKQKQILNFVTNYSKKHDLSPSIEEVSKKFRRSISTIHQHIEALKEKGYLTRKKNQKRGIEIPKKEKLVRIPLLGTIAAGQPIEAIEIPGLNVIIPQKEISPIEKYYALRVKGDSMINEGIFDSDIVIIRKQETADDGQTVVAIIDDNEATLKKFYRENSKVRLQPANKNMSPIYRREVEIRGIVVKIIRDFETTSQNEVTYNKKEDKKIVLGQFYTSEEVADFMVSLTTKSKKSKALDPGYGEGVFIKSLLKRGFKNVTGYDIDEKNYRIAESDFGEKVEIKLGDYLKTTREEKFDLIIGNPPYVQWNNIQEDIREKLSKDNFWTEYSNGEWDLLYAFIIWSIEKLNEDGELIYIVPYNWFNSTYAASLRKYLIDNGQFEIICHFGEFKLFKDCYPNNIIFKYRKIKNKNRPLIFVSEYKGRKGNVQNLLSYIKKEFKKINHKEYEKEDKNFRIFTTNQFETENLWHLATTRERKYIDDLENITKRIKLNDYLDVGVGIVSGYDEAYVLNSSEINDFSEEEKRLIFPFVKAKNCERYFIQNGSYFIFADTIQTEKELKKYPKIYKRLLKYKEKLNKRYLDKNKNWWNWATIRNKQLFEKSLNKPKIFVPCIDRSLKARYSYTDGNYFGSGDVLITINKNGLREDLRYILAWLNSKLVNDWYRVKGSHSGYRIRYTQSYVSQIPLKLINWNNKKEVEIYNKILEKTKKIIKERGNEKLESEIDKLFKTLVL